jgi:hypothetical protein
MLHNMPREMREHQLVVQEAIDRASTHLIAQSAGWAVNPSMPDAESPAYPLPCQLDARRQSVLSFIQIFFALGKRVDGAAEQLR